MIHSTTATGIFVIDSSYSDAASLTTALSGEYLYYELATPLTYVLDTPIPVSYKVDGDGTENVIPEGTASAPIAPLKADILYALNAAGTLARLDANYVKRSELPDLISVESLDELLTVLGTQLGGTFTRSWDGTKYTFEFTPTL